MLALHANGISKTYRNSLVLTSMDLSVEEGSVHALIGPAGCANKIAANIFCGMLPASRGTCMLFETSIKDTKNVHSICGLSNSQIELYPHLTGLDNLVLIASFFGIDKNTAQQKASSLMKELGIWDEREKLYKDYSDISKKLLSLARAMLHSPKILFLEKNKDDDNLKYNKTLSDFIKHHNKDDNLTVCIVTDDPKFAMENADYFTVMKKNKVIISGSLPELLEQYPLKTYARIKCRKKLEGFTSTGDFQQREVKDENEFSKILLDTVLLGAQLTSAELITPDFETVYNKIMEENTI